MARRFAALRIHDFTGARFEEYVDHPEALEEQALALWEADALRRGIGGAGTFGGGGRVLSGGN